MSRARFKVILAFALAIAPAVVLAGEPEQGTLEELSLAGRLATESRLIHGYTRARRTMLLATEVAGRIASIALDAGATVPTDAGDKPFVFATIADDRYRLLLASERAALAQAIEDARYREEERQRLDRLGTLATEEERLARAHAAEQARLVVTTIESRVALAEDMVARCVVTAPGGWYVLRRLAEPGEMLQMGAPLAELADFRSLEVELRLDETELRALRALPHPHLTLSNRAPGETPEPLVVDEMLISPDFDPGTRKRGVILRFDAARLSEASAGLRCEITLAVPDPAGAYLVPARFVETRYEETLVRTTKGPLSVTVLGRTEDELEILAPGLDATTVLLAPAAAAR